jgi:hypothetical protein
MQDVDTRNFCIFALVQHDCITMNSAALLSPNAQKNPWSNTIKADDQRTIYLTHITFNNIPSSPNAKKTSTNKTVLCILL